MLTKVSKYEQLKVPKKLGLDGRYTIEEHLGSGGMGDVFLATDSLLNRQVALKILVQSKIRKGEERDRFLSEARVLANLRHENLVSVYELDFDNDPVFIAQRYLPGGDLDRVIEDGKLMKKRQAWQLIYDLANALAYLHENRIVHRDIKPANILFDEDGRAFLSDFGLVRELDVTRFTETQALVGTPLFVVPEVLDGANHEMAGDIFQFGLVVHYALTGNHRFCKVDSFHKYVIALSDGNESELLDDTELPSPFDELVAHCCQSNPLERPKNGAALRKFIEQLPRDPTITIDRGAREKGQKKSHPSCLVLPRTARFAVSALVLLMVWVLWTYLSTVFTNRVTLNGRIRDNVLFPDGFCLVLSKTKASGPIPQWKLFTAKHELMSQGSGQSTTAGFVIEAHGLPTNFRGELKIQDGKAVGTVAVELPPTVFKKPIKVLFGRDWFKLFWQLHGTSDVDLIYEANGRKFAKQALRNGYVRCEVGNDLRKEEIHWQLLHRQRLLASGKGRTGLRILTAIERTDLFGNKNVPSELSEPLSRPLLHDGLLWIALKGHVVLALNLKINKGNFDCRFANKEYFPDSFRQKENLKFIVPAGKNKIMALFQNKNKGVLLPMRGRSEKNAKPLVSYSLRYQPERSFARAFGEKTIIALYAKGQIEVLSYDHERALFSEEAFMRADDLLGLECNNDGVYLCYQDEDIAQLALFKSKKKIKSITFVKSNEFACSYSNEKTAVFITANVAYVFNGQSHHEVRLPSTHRLHYYPPISLDDECSALLVTGLLPRENSLLRAQALDFIYLPLRGGAAQHFKKVTASHHNREYLLQVGPCRYKDKIYVGTGSHLQIFSSRPPFNLAAESFIETTLRRAPLVFKEHLFIAVRKGNFCGFALE